MHTHTWEGVDFRGKSDFTFSFAKALRLHIFSAASQQTAAFPCQSFFLG